MRISDWSSDVCSSDLVGTEDPDGPVEDLDGLVEAELDGIGHGREELIAGGHRRQQGCVSHGGAGSAGEGRSGGHETQPDGNEHPTQRPAANEDRCQRSSWHSSAGSSPCGSLSRSEARCVRKARVSTGTSRRPPHHYNNNPPTPT